MRDRSRMKYPRYSRSTTCGSRFIRAARISPRKNETELDHHGRVQPPLLPPSKCQHIPSQRHILSSATYACANLPPNTHIPTDEHIFNPETHDRYLRWPAVPLLPPHTDLFLIQHESKPAVLLLDMEHVGPVAQSVTRRGCGQLRHQGFMLCLAEQCYAGV